MSRNREDIIDAEVLSEQGSSALLTTKQSSIIGATLLAISIVAGVIWVLTQSTQQDDRVTSETAIKNSQQIELLHEQLNSSLQGLEESIQSSRSSSQELLGQQQQQLDVLNSNLGDSLQKQRKEFHSALQQESRLQQEKNVQLGQSVAALAQRLDHREDNLHLSAALRLLQIAEEQLTIVHDMESTQQALAQAARQLSEAGDPMLIPIQGMIQEEIRTVSGTVIPNLQAPMSKLNRIISNIGKLPIQTGHYSHSGDEEELTTTESTGDQTKLVAAGESSSTDGYAGWSWEGILEKIWSDLHGLIRIEKRELDLPVIATQAEERIGRQILQLRLEQAQSALILRDTAIFHERINSASEWLGIFDQSSSEVQSVSQQLSLLASLELSPQLPIIGHAHKRLKTLLDSNSRDMSREPAS